MFLKLFNIAIILIFSLNIEGEFERIFNKIEGNSRPETILNTGKLILNKSYVAKTLEINQKEALVCNFEGLDCATFVENVTAFMILREQKVQDFKNFKNILTNLRYQNGQINGYESRIHYFSDWLVRNQNFAKFKNISKDLGGEVFSKKINFMSENAHFYPALSNKNVLEKIKIAENELNLNPFYYVPKDKVAQILPKINSGDIIAFTSTVDKLDVNHEGFAVKKGNEIYLMHASLEKKKVIVSEETLLQYLNRIKKHSGIIVARFDR